MDRVCNDTDTSTGNVHSALRAVDVNVRTDMFSNERLVGSGNCLCGMF